MIRGAYRSAVAVKTRSEAVARSHIAVCVCGEDIILVLYNPF